MAPPLPLFFFLLCTCEPAQPPPLRVSLPPMRRRRSPDRSPESGLLSSACHARLTCAVECLHAGAPFAEIQVVGRGWCWRWGETREGGRRGLFCQTAHLPSSLAPPPPRPPRGRLSPRPDARAPPGPGQVCAGGVAESGPIARPCDGDLHAKKKKTRTHPGVVPTHACPQQTPAPRPRRATPLSASPSPPAGTPGGESLLRLGAPAPASPHPSCLPLPLQKKKKT